MNMDPDFKYHCQFRVTRPSCNSCEGMTEVVSTSNSSLAALKAGLGRTGRTAFNMSENMAAEQGVLEEFQAYRSNNQRVSERVIACETAGGGFETLIGREVIFHCGLERP